MSEERKKFEMVTVYRFLSYPAVHTVTVITMFPVSPGKSVREIFELVLDKHPELTPENRQHVYMDIKRHVGDQYLSTRPMRLEPDSVEEVMDKSGSVTKEMLIQGIRDSIGSLDIYTSGSVDQNGTRYNLVGLVNIIAGTPRVLTSSSEGPNVKDFQYMTRGGEQVIGMSEALYLLGRKRTWMFKPARWPEKYQSALTQAGENQEALAAVLIDVVEYFMSKEEDEDYDG